MENQTKIVKIEKVKKNRQKYEVTFKTAEATDTIVFYEDQIIEYRIFKDKEYTLEEWEKIKKASEIGNVFNKALNYISFKMRTSKEVERYLKEQALSDETIQEILKKLENYHFIDDEKYAKLFVESSVRNAKGKNYVRNTLREKGVKDNIISDALINYNEDEVFEIILTKMRKEASKKTNDSVKRKKEKMVNKLLRDGFDASFIKKIMEEIEFSNEDKELLLRDYEKVSNKTEDKNKIIAKLLSKGYNYSDIKELVFKNK